MGIGHVSARAVAPAFPAPNIAGCFAGGNGISLIESDSATIAAQKVAPMNSV
jgi:hypothetical protein